MKKNFFGGIVWIFFLLPLLTVFNLSCLKNRPEEEHVCTIGHTDPSGPCYNLDVILNGNAKEKQFGFIKFRQDPDTARIVTLETSIVNLAPNHEYLLQRAVDAVVDGDCTSTNWLTLGKGSTPQSILTDAHGNGREELWRDLTAAARGTTFDIHFQVIDATSLETVLTSDCYQFTVR
jgi:hypothetical protein